MNCVRNCIPGFRARAFGTSRNDKCNYFFLFATTAPLPQAGSAAPLPQAIGR